MSTDQRIGLPMGYAIGLPITNALGYLMGLPMGPTMAKRWLCDSTNTDTDTDTVFSYSGRAPHSHLCVAKTAWHETSLKCAREVMP